MENGLDKTQAIMEHPQNIYQYLAKLKESGAFTPLDLEELEDHLEEEVSFQSNYLSKEEAHEKAIRQLGKEPKLIKAYRKKNFWKLLEEQYFLVMAGMVFILFLRNTLGLIYLLTLSANNPILGYLSKETLWVISFLPVIGVSYAIGLFIFRSGWRFTIPCNLSRGYKRFSFHTIWMLPVAYFGGLFLCAYLQPKNIHDFPYLYSIFNFVTSFIFPLIWTVLSVFNFLRFYHLNKQFDIRRFGFISFFFGSTLYYLIYQIAFFLLIMADPFKYGYLYAWAYNGLLTGTFLIFYILLLRRMNGKKRIVY